MSEPEAKPEKKRNGSATAAVKGVRKHFVRKIESYNLMQAFGEVWKAKQHSKNIGFAAIAEKWGEKEGTLRQYWSLYTRGRLDPGLPLTAKDVEMTARAAHEKQLALLRRMQGLLLSGADEMLMKVERSHAKGAKVMVELKKNDGMELMRALKHTNEMIVQTERGYLALLDEYSAKTRERETQIVGKEVHATIETMTTEARAMRALQEMENQTDAPTEPPTIEIESSPAVPVTEPPKWNRPTT